MSVACGPLLSPSGTASYRAQQTAESGHNNTESNGINAQHEKGQIK